MAPQPDMPRSSLGDIVAGLGLGAFVGSLLGLTTSGVVGAIIGALVGLVATFVGLNAGAQPALAAASVTRLAAFSIAATVCLLLGVTARTHEWLAPTTAALMADLKGAGFPDDEARALYRYQRFGLLPGGVVAAPNDSPVVRQGAGSLFSFGGDDCNSLHRDRSLPSATAKLDRLKLYGGTFADIGRRIDRLPADRQSQILDAAEFYLCGTE